MAKQGSEEEMTRKPESEEDKEFKDPDLPEEGTRDACDRGRIEKAASL